MLIPSTRKANAGFSLVELMVGLAVGLVLMSAMVALVLSVLRANAEATASARLTQEGRAIGDLIQREIKRARYAGSHLEFVGAGATPANPFGQVNMATAGCVKFAYDVDDDGVLDANEVKSIFLSGGGVYFAQGTTYAGTTCSNTASPTLKLSSPDVRVNTLSFAERVDNPSTPAVNEANKNEIIVQYAIELTRKAGDDTNIGREFDQTIQLRNPYLN